LHRRYRGIIGDSYDYWNSCRENGTYRDEKDINPLAYQDTANCIIHLLPAALLSSLDQN
jgi:hypothetical protein